MGGMVLFAHAPPAHPRCSRDTISHDFRFLQACAPSSRRRSIPSDGPAFSCSIGAKMAKAPPDTRVREVQPIAAPGPGEVPCLEVISGKSSGKVFPLRPAATSTVGRDPTCDVVLEDDGISRQHARLHGGETLWIEDLAST